MEVRKWERRTNGGLKKPYKSGEYLRHHHLLTDTASPEQKHYLSDVSLLTRPALSPCISSGFAGLRRHKWVT